MESHLKRPYEAAFRAELITRAKKGNVDALITLVVAAHGVLRQQLAARGADIPPEYDAHGAGVSPGLYLAMMDLDTAVTSLARVLASGEWR